MQEVLLDGRRLTLSESSTWSALIGELEASHLSDGRMILSVSIDGEELSDYRDETIDANRLDTMERVEVRSVGMEDYSRELLAEAPKHLEQVIQVLARSALLYRQNVPTDAASSLHQALSGLDMLIQLLASVSAVFSVELKKLDNAHAFDEAALLSLRDALETVVQCQEADDRGRLPDVLEKELIPRLAPWGTFFAGLHEQLPHPNTDQ